MSGVGTGSLEAPSIIRGRQGIFRELMPLALNQRVLGSSASASTTLVQANTVA
jgi:hypothetical protein